MYMALTESALKSTQIHEKHLVDLKLPLQCVIHKMISTEPYWSNLDAFCKCLDAKCVHVEEIHAKGEHNYVFGDSILTVGRPYERDGIPKHKEVWLLSGTGTRLNELMVMLFDAKALANNREVELATFAADKKAGETYAAKKGVKIGNRYREFGDSFATVEVVDFNHDGTVLMKYVDPRFGLNFNTTATKLHKTKLVK